MHKKYGLGLVKPGGFGLTKYTKVRCVLITVRFKKLAEKMAVDAVDLLKMGQKKNYYAEQGYDLGFGK